MISNASDALDRLRFEALTNPALLEEIDKYEIRLETDKEARTLSISDMGIGMSRDEVIANIGTIARSGTDELRKVVEASPTAQAPYDMFYHGYQGGLCLYAKRVMVIENCADLLPGYLRFIKGVVDSADLPLNISRQILQQDRHITQIRKC